MRLSFRKFGLIAVSTICTLFGFALIASIWEDIYINSPLFAIFSSIFFSASTNTVLERSMAPSDIMSNNLVVNNDKIFSLSSDLNNPEITYTPYLSKSTCRIGIVSTFPPRKCGIAQFTKHFIDVFIKASPEYTQQQCELEVLALVDVKDYVPNMYSEHPTQDAPYLIIPILIDTAIPSNNIWKAAQYINASRFSHILLQQEFGITPIMWQLADLVRWISDSIDIVTVVHSPLAYANVEAIGMLRQLARFSRKLVVMSWHAANSLVHAYGIPAEKVVFIPHGIFLIQMTNRDAPLSSLSHVVNNVTITEATLLGLDKDDIVILSNGLIHPSKGLARLIRIMPSLLEVNPHIKFLIVGQEHPTSPEKIMGNLLAMVKLLGLENNVIWVNRFLTESQLEQYFARADIYITLFDEITPTSGTLLTAMSYGLATVSTPYRFAAELLTDGRGIIVPYENNVETRHAFLQLINDKAKRMEMGRKAREFVTQWSWEAVAKEYGKLILGSSSSLGSLTPITPNPFADEPVLFPAVAGWTSQSIQSFDNFDLRKYMTTPITGVYCLYVDHQIQINAKMESDTRITSIGITTSKSKTLVHFLRGIEYSQTGNGVDSAIQINHTTSTITIFCDNISAVIMLNTATSSLHVSIMGISRFASPGGILGSTLRCKYDLFQKCTKHHIDWATWNIPTASLFDTNSRGQSWSLFGIRTNILMLHENDLLSEVYNFYPKSESHENDHGKENNESNDSNSNTSNGNNNNNSSDIDTEKQKEEIKGKDNHLPNQIDAGANKPMNNNAFAESSLSMTTALH